MKLSYTSEMLEQDTLWQNESEDLNVMEKLHQQIVNEAMQKGFNGITKTYLCNNEVVTEVYETIEEMQKVENGTLHATCCGYCKSLIEALESLL